MNPSAKKLVQMDTGLTDILENPTQLNEYMDLRGRPTVSHFCRQPLQIYLGVQRWDF